MATKRAWGGHINIRRGSAHAIQKDVPKDDSSREKLAPRGT